MREFLLKSMFIQMLFFILLSLYYKNKKALAITLIYYCILFSIVYFHYDYIAGLIMALPFV